MYFKSQFKSTRFVTTMNNLFCIYFSKDVKGQNLYRSLDNPLYGEFVVVHSEKRSCFVRVKSKQTVLKRERSK